MMGDDVQFLNTTRFGAPAAGSRRRNPQHSCVCGTAGPTAAPDCSCLEPLPPVGMTALCFENSTASIINDIVCRAAAEAGLWPKWEDTWRYTAGRTPPAAAR